MMVDGRAECMYVCGVPKVGGFLLEYIHVCMYICMYMGVNG